MRKEATRARKIEEADASLEKIYGSQEAAKRLMDSLRGTEPLGKGAEKLVYDYRDGQVVAFFPNFLMGDAGYANYLKKIYYANKLMHLLLPENVPDAHLVGSDPPLMILDKVEKPDKEPLIEERWAEMDMLFSKVDALEVSIDRTSSNFILDREGRLQYVDSFSFTSASRKPLKEAISKLEDPADQKRAARYAHRAGIWGRSPVITG